MDDTISDLVDRWRAFFGELNRNNNRDWFEANRSRFRRDVQRPAEQLALDLTAPLNRLTGYSHEAKVFRVHRDLRFTKDKTPYNTHLHLSWTPQSAGTPPVWFFGSGLDYLVFGCGLMALKGQALDRFRALVDADGEDLQEALEEARDEIGATLSDWGPAPLKRVPKPYAPDHPQSELLRRKAFAVSAPMPDGWREAGLLPTLQDMARALLPVWHMLNEGMR